MARDILHLATGNNSYNQVLSRHAYNYSYFYLFSSVDMWSVGCIMAEVLTGQVLFPGSDRILLFKKEVYFLHDIVLITVTPD